METQETRLPSPNLSAQAPRLKRPTRGPLGRLTLIAYFGYVLLYVVYFLFALFVFGIVFLPALLFAGFLLPFAALLATRWRFALLPAALVSLLTVTFLFLQPHNLYVLTHVQPEFSLLVPMMALGLVAGVAGVWATVEIYRDDRDEHRAPRYLGHSLSGLAGIVIGMVLVALLVSSAPQTAGVSVGPHGEPTTHMTPSAFVPNVVLVPIGLSLQIVADSSAKHILANGRWDANGIPHPLVEPGAPALHDMAMTGGSMEIGPFTTPGVYHVYCTIHPRMNLTVVVE